MLLPRLGSVSIHIPSGPHCRTNELVNNSPSLVERGHRCLQRGVAEHLFKNITRLCRIEPSLVPIFLLREPTFYVAFAEVFQIAPFGRMSADTVECRGQWRLRLPTEIVHDFLGGLNGSVVNSYSDVARTRTSCAGRDSAAKSGMVSRSQHSLPQIEVGFANQLLFGTGVATTAKCDEVDFLIITRVAIAVMNLQNGNTNFMALRIRARAPHLIKQPVSECYRRLWTRFGHARIFEYLGAETN